MNDTPSAFEDLVAELEYPMFILTTAVDGERSGCLIGFAAQCSINPPRFMVWVSKKNHTAALAARTTTFAVHVLHEHDVELARLFGETTGDVVDKFEHCEWDDGPNGVPVLRGCDWFAGDVLERVDTGDHVGYLLALPGSGRAERAHEPQLGFQAVKDFDPGHGA